jgi:uncharacterized membrane protein YfcA
MSFDLLALLGGCFIAAFCSGLAGFAFNLVAAGILYHWVTPQEIAPVLVLGSMLIQSVTLRVVWPAIRWPVLKPYVFAGVLGTPFGVWALSVVEARVIVAGIGILLVGYAGFMLARIALRLSPPKLSAGPRADAVVGFFAGALGGIGGFSGALPSMWTDVKGLRKDEARAIFQPFIVVMQIIAAAGLAYAGFFTLETGRTLLIALPALALGTWLGMRAYRVIPAEGFRLVLLGLLFLSGLSLVV